MEDLVRLQGERIAVLETSAQSIKQRLDDQAAILESMREMSSTLKGILGEIKYMRADIDSVRIDIDTLKAKPGKRWETLVEQAIALLSAALIGGLLAKLVTG